MKKIKIEEIQIHPIRPLNGLVAFASAVINNEFGIGNIAIYTSPTSKHGYRLVYPTKKLSNGTNVECFFPLNQCVEQQVTDAIVLKYLDLMQNFS